MISNGPAQRPDQDRTEHAFVSGQAWPAEHQSRARIGVCFITGTEIVIDGGQFAVM
jgi:hypothetical protein